jgi:hypothetical protein
MPVKAPVEHEPRNGKDPAKAGPLNRNPLIGGDQLCGFFRPDRWGASPARLVT